MKSLDSAIPAMKNPIQNVPGLQAVFRAILLAFPAQGTGSKQGQKNRADWACSTLGMYGYVVLDPSALRHVKMELATDWPKASPSVLAGPFGMVAR